MAASPPQIEGSSELILFLVLENVLLDEDTCSALACVSRCVRAMSQPHRVGRWLAVTKSRWLSPPGESEEGVLLSSCLGFEARFVFPPGAGLETRGPLKLQVQTPYLNTWRPDDPRRAPLVTFSTIWTIHVARGVFVWDKLQLNRCSSERLEFLPDRDLPGDPCARCGSIPPELKYSPNCAEGRCCRTLSCYRKDEGHVCYYECHCCGEGAVRVEYWDGEVDDPEVPEEQGDYQASIVNCTECSAPNLVYWEWFGVSNAERNWRSD